MILRWHPEWLAPFGSRRRSLVISHKSLWAGLSLTYPQADILDRAIIDYFGIAARLETETLGKLRPVLLRT